MGTNNLANPALVPRCVDARSAFLLSACFGVSAAAAVLVLGPSMAPGGWQPPLPWPAFAALVALQGLIIYGLVGWAGLRLGRASGLESATFLTTWSTGRAPGGQAGRHMARALGFGLVCGVALVLAVMAIQFTAPGSLPAMLHHPSIPAALAASAAASIGEEILCRLFLLSAVLRLLPRRPAAPWVAVIISSIAFGALHCPALVFLFGGIESVPALAWLWVIGLNAMVGACCGVLFLRHGIGAAIACHFGVERSLFPFLTDTHAVLQPAFPDDCDVVFSGRYFYHGTARAYAATYAEWACHEGWLGRSDWKYIDLYYSQALSQGVFNWINTLYEVVLQKCEC